MKTGIFTALLAMSTACSLPASTYPRGESHPACASAPVAQTIVNPDALVDSTASESGDDESTTDHSAHQQQEHHHGHGGHGK